MSTPLHALVSGTFTSDGNVYPISLPCGYDSIELINISDIGDTSAATPVMRAQGTSYMAAGSAYVAAKTTLASTVALENTILSNGFSFIADSGVQSNSAALTATAISAASPAVVSLGTTTGLANGDVVRIINSTGMLQIAGMEFTIGSLTPSTSFELSFLDASGFAAAATAASVVKVSGAKRYQPSYRFITGITNANQAVVTLSVAHDYKQGQQVRVIVPDSFGMSQINNLAATIIGIDNVNNTITLNINSSGFTAFAFPTSAQAASGISFPLIVPFGETAAGPVANSLDDSVLNTSFTGILVGSSVQTNGSTYQWLARKGVNTSLL